MTMLENLVRCGFVVILFFCFQNRLESSFQAALDSISGVVTIKLLFSKTVADGLK